MIFADHDIHCHTKQSLCSGDSEMTVENILRHAEEKDYSTVCITDHFWDKRVRGASPWYALQGLGHIKKNLPLPHSDKVRMCFGAETEYCGGKKLGIKPETFEKFDFVVIPVNHFHMKNFTRPSSVDSEEKIAELFITRLEELISLKDIPWRKVGIAHLNCSLTFSEGNCFKVFNLIDEERISKVFDFFAENGTGIELNSSCFDCEWEGNEDAHLRLFRLAKKAGCKFYCASDAHHLDELDYSDLFFNVIEMLGLKEEDKYMIK